MISFFAWLGDRGSKFIAVYNKSSFIAIIAQLAGNHLDWHSDLDGVVIHVGELGRDHRALFEFHKGNGVGSVRIVTTGRLVDGGVRIHFTFAAKGIELFGFVATIWADISRGKDLVIAMRADFADQPVALFLESPMSGDFHE